MTRYLVIRREQIRFGKYSERVLSDCATKADAKRIAIEHNERDSSAGITYHVLAMPERSK